MSRNDLKKIFVYSNSTRRHFIDNALSDLAEVEHTSLSIQIESFLLKGILPQNEEAAYQVQMMYEDDLPINKVLFNVYSYLSSGTDNKPLHNNVLSLVRYSYELSCFAHGEINVGDDGIHNFKSSLDSLVDTLERETKKNNIYEAKDSYKFAKELNDIANSNIESLRLFEIWGVIINNWGVLYDERITYRLMAYMSELQIGLKDTADSRIKLIRILTEVSNEWE